MPEPSSIDVGAVRAFLPATARVTYLNTGWQGPAPTPVVQAIEHRLRLESEEGPTSPAALEAIEGITQAARSAFAELLGADAAEIVLTANTTHGINIVLSGLEWQAGDEIITSKTEHFAVLIPLYHLRDRTGVSLKFVDLQPEDPPHLIIEKLDAAITPRTRLIALSHIMYTTGLRLPVQGIQEMAGRRRVQVLVDAAQCPGHIPLDVHAWSCDYYAIPAHKWLLGPTGVGALFVRRNLLPELHPVHVSFGAALAFDTVGCYTPNREAPEKFESSTPSLPLLAGATAAIRFLQKFGIDRIEQRSRALANRLRAGLRKLPSARVILPDGGPTSCNLVTVRLDRHDPIAIVNALWDRQRIIARSVPDPSAVRFSVAFFNTEEEIDRTVDLMMLLERESPG